MGFVGRLCTSRSSRMCTSGPVVWPDCILYVEHIPPSSVVEGSLAGRGESVTQNPPAKIGIRSHRELVTLALVVDDLLEGWSVQALDILLQRFKAVKASFKKEVRIAAKGCASRQ